MCLLKINERINSLAKIKCFLITGTEIKRSWYRRHSIEHTCKDNSYHDAQILIGDDVIQKDSKGFWLPYIPEKEHEKNCNYPTKCNSCEYLFKEDDCRHIFNQEIYKDVEGKEYFLQHLVPGTIYRMPWLEEKPNFRGIDGKSYGVQTPGGFWVIDSRAKNCTRPNDLIHKCWCRHGEAPNFTVDKDGFTCEAGAGSIQCGSYHGFLRNGYLEE